MATGTVTLVERYDRLKKVKDLLDEGKESSEISKELDIPIRTVQRYEKYIAELALSDISKEEIAEKRQEIYLEALEASNEARTQFMKFRDEEKAQSAKMFFAAWMDSLKLRMQLYGLDSVRSTPTTQINQQINTYEPEKVDSEIGKKLSDLIKKSHEAKLKNVTKEDSGGD